MINMGPGGVPIIRGGKKKATQLEKMFITEQNKKDGGGELVMKGHKEKKQFVLERAYDHRREREQKLMETP